MKKMDSAIELLTEAIRKNRKAISELNQYAEEQADELEHAKFETMAKVIQLVTGYQVENHGRKLIVHHPENDEFLRKIVACFGEYEIRFNREYQWIS